MRVKQQTQYDGYLIAFRPAVYVALLMLGIASTTFGQVAAGMPMRSGEIQRPHDELQQQNDGRDAGDDSAQSNLTRGSLLTRQGQFTEAIPLLQAAQAQDVSNYAAGFNLAVCYIATGQFSEAVKQLRELENNGQRTAAVYNLLAQAYLGLGQRENAWAAIQMEVKLAPKDEKMYAFLLDACTDHYEYDLGLKVTALGLLSLPNSVRLHYERAVFLARLDRLEEAKPEFAKAASLDPKGDLGYLSLVQVQLYDQDFPKALATIHEAIKAGHHDYQMLALLGTVLMQAGAIPGQSEFVEAQNALERSVAEHAEYATSQIALGKLYLMEGRNTDAIAHLEVGRRLDPQNPAVYTSLAEVYRLVGNKEASKQSWLQLSALLREKANSHADAVIRR